MSKIYGIPVGGGSGSGMNGRSAYELAVAEGFEGTLSQWLASLVGEQGVPGEQGPQGEQGIPGEQGPKGDTGKNAAWNLLDNSDFRNPVNQRGQASYTGLGYKIDRWKTDSEDCVLTVQDGYISVANRSIAQIVDCAAGEYSAFACDINGALTSLQIQLNSDQTYTVFIPAGDWIWAVMYEGKYTAETLPEYHPKGYAHELMECQRYYRVLDSECVGNGYTTGAGGGAIMCLPFTMRTATPAVVCSDLTCRVNGADYSCEVVGVQTFNGVTMRLVLNAANAPAKHAAAFYSLSAFALSADL